VFLGGWVLRPVLDSAGVASSTLVTFIGCTDLKGTLPAAIKRKLNEKQPGLVNAIKPVLAKRAADLAKMSIDDREKAIAAQKELIDVLPTYTDVELAEYIAVAK
jgi:hypothetical protein